MYLIDKETCYNFLWIKGWTKYYVSAFSEDIPLFFSAGFCFEIGSPVSHSHIMSSIIKSSVYQGQINILLCCQFMLNESVLGIIPAIK